LSKPDFSPAPWRTSELDRRVLEDKDGRVIADLRSWKEFPDDGKLLAASREMYDFLDNLSYRHNYTLQEKDFRAITELLEKAGRQA
jgi:predicted deacetylase